MESVAGPGPPEALMGWSRFVSQENPAPESGGRGGGGGGEHLSGLRTPLPCAACGPAYLPQPDARGGGGETRGQGHRVPAAALAVSVPAKF